MKVGLSLKKNKKRIINYFLLDFMELLVRNATISVNTTKLTVLCITRNIVKRLFLLFLLHVQLNLSCSKTRDMERGLEHYEKEQ